MISPGIFDGLGVASSREPVLERFVELVEKWNRAINLTAAKTRAELVEHVVDSLHVVPHLKAQSRVLDVGSGGGFPVVVAAICLPTVELVSLEPTHKKHAFLRTVARELDLANLTPLAMRLEEHAVRDYDAAMSRATFDLVTWLHKGGEYVRDGGFVIGFEALQHGALPPTAQRHTYEVEGKARAIVILHR